ncbi:MAG: M48 family metalloprotease [Sphingobacteriales bacterium]|nr:M48 family metalloprotease [Sphingobacteriales bacterium]
MQATSHLYPPSPAHVPTSVTEVSPAFRKEVKGVMTNLLLFFGVYVLLFIFSLVLIAACVLVGITIMGALRHFIGIVIGVGLIGLGVMIFIFLIKFLFAVSRRDLSDAVEIKEKDQPELFAFIRQLTADTQTRFPKKIYLTPDVNASVFYNASFLSMFLPVRKNLQIGLGLVNSLNVGEFKAVMAHEFGHFSQRSMKLGSYVYNVNRVIYNMLFENNSYGNMLSRWASAGDVFLFFAKITAWIVTGIQKILASMYELVNKRYRSLSREMEFHADAVAASVSGSENLVTALRRIEFSAQAYHLLQGYCEEQAREKKWPDNIYPVHHSILLRMAADNDIPVAGGLPVIDDAKVTATSNSRIIYRDQWASHPVTQDRVEKLREWAVSTKVVQEPAWTLFRQAGQLQQALTVKMYGETAAKPDMQQLPSAAFTEEVLQRSRQYQVPAAYNGVYNQRVVSLLSPEQLQTLLPDTAISFTDIFNSAFTSLVNTVAALETDINILQAMRDGQLTVSSFDFNGQKYDLSDAEKVQQQLQLELEENNRKLEALDRQAVTYFLGKVQQRDGQTTALLKKYEKLYEWSERIKETATHINEMFTLLQPVYAGQAMNVQAIHSMIADLKAKHEPVFKTDLTYWREAGVFMQHAELEKMLGQLLAADFHYFDGEHYIEAELILLHRLGQEGYGAIQAFFIREFINLLEWQLTLVPAAELSQQH